MNLQKGLVAHWTSDNRDTSGGLLYDRSAYNSHGTLQNVTTGKDGAVGESYGYDGSTTYVDVSSTLWNEYFGDGAKEQSWSISAFVKPNNLAQGYNDSTAGAILGQRYGTSTVYGLREDGSVFLCLDDTRAASPESTGTVSENQWHHVVVTYSWDDDLSTTPYGEATFYIDGEFAGTDTNDDDAGVTTDSNLYIGYDSREAMHLDGDICDVRVYNWEIPEAMANGLAQMRAPRVKNPQTLWEDHFTDDRDDRFYQKVVHVSRGTNTNGGWIWETENQQLRSDDSNDCMTIHTNQGNLDSTDGVSVKVEYLGTTDNDTSGICIYDKSQDRWYEGNITNDHGSSGICYQDRGNEPTLIAGGNNYDVTANHSFELVYDDGGLSFYVDGELSAEATETIAPSGFGVVSGAQNPPSYWDSLIVEKI